MTATPTIITQPLIILFEHEGNLVCHLHPRQHDTYEGYGLMICDLIRHVARNFDVSEHDVFEWVKREYHKPTTELTRAS